MYTRLKKEAKCPTDPAALRKIAAAAAKDANPDAPARDKARFNEAKAALKAAGDAVDRRLAEALIVAALNVVKRDRRQNVSREYGRAIGLPSVNHVKLSDFFESDKDDAPDDWDDIPDLE